MDYKENYLKERLGRLKAEAELTVIRHERILKDYDKTKLDLDNYLIEKHQTEAVAKEKEEKYKKRTSKRRKKDEG